MSIKTNRMVVGGLLVAEYQDAIYSTKEVNTLVNPGDVGWDSIWKPGLGDGIEHNIGKLTECGHNSMLFLINGRMYSAFGDALTWPSSTSGRGDNGTLAGRSLKNCSSVAIPTKNPIAYYAGGYHAYAIAVDTLKNAFVWGNNVYGACGLGTTSAVIYPTFLTADVEEVYCDASQSEFDVNANRLILRKTDGYLYGAGYNGNGQLGLGDVTDRTTLTQLTAFGQIPVDGKKRVWNMGCGTGCIAVHDAQNRLMVAGHNGNYSLGFTSSTVQTTPMDVTVSWTGQTSVDEVLDVVTGGQFYSTSSQIVRSMVMLYRANPGDFTTVKACGYNGDSQCGDGTTTNRTVPATPIGLPTNMDCIQIGMSGALGGYFALYENGDLYAWGRNTEDQIPGSTGNAANAILTATNVEKILCPVKNGQYYGYQAQTTVKKTDGLLYMAGFSTTYQIPGNAANIGVFTPVYFPDGGDIVDLGCFTTNDSNFTYVAKTSKNNLYAWGDNAHYGVFDDLTYSVQQPVQLNFYK